MNPEILIIGAGVTGCSVARVLSRYEGDITVIDCGMDVAEGASKANSGIVHAGFDAKPGTLKAKLNVTGAKMYPALSKELGVSYGQPGALVIGFTEEDRATLENLVKQAELNGVAVRLIEHDEILKMEPNTNPDVLCALYAPTSGLTSPYEMTYALADHAAVNGVKFVLNEEVEGVVKGQEGKWHVTTDKGERTCDILVNCAGVGAATIEEVFLRKEKRKSRFLGTPSGEKKSSLCERSLLLGGADHCVNECSLLFAGAVQISKMAADCISVCGGRARHQFAFPFGGRGFMHDDTDFLPSLDSAAPPDCSMIWRSACPA